MLKVWIGVSGLKFGLMLVDPLKPDVFNPQSLMSYPIESFHSLLTPKFYKLFFFFGETNLKLNITTLKPTHCHPQNTITSPDHSYVLYQSWSFLYYLFSALFSHAKTIQIAELITLFTFSKQPNICYCLNSCVLITKRKMCLCF